MRNQPRRSLEYITEHPRIRTNKAQCKLCKDIIESRHVHDFVSCRCGSVSVDGGREYLRRLGATENIKELSEWYD